MSTAVELRSTEITRLSEYVEAIAWSPDSACVAAGSLAGELVVAPVHGGSVQELPGHGFGTTAVAWSPDGRRLASAGQDGVVNCWDAGSGARTGGVAGRGWAAALAWRPDGSECAAAIGRAVVWTDRDGGELRRAPDAPSTVTGIAWTPDGRRLAAGAYGGLWWYEASTEPMKHFAWKGAVLSVEIAPNGKYVATGNQDNSVHCWRLWSGDDFQMSGYEAKIQHVAWSADSRYLAVAGLGDITVWDFAGRGPQGTTPRQLAGHARHLVALAYRPTGDGSLFSAAADGRICLWRPGSGRRALVGQAGLYEPISTACWSPDGSAIAAGTARGAVVVVEVA